MKITFTLFLILLFTGAYFTSRAGERDTTVKKLPQAAGRNDSVSASQKICSCQLMSVQTDQDNSHLVGIFAEKTLEGKQLNNYRLMNEYIRREKIYFSIVFARSVGRKEMIQSETNCISLYNKLKKENRQLEIYNILDVDLLLAVAKK